MRRGGVWTYDVDQHRDEDGTCDGAAIFRVLITANELGVILAEQNAENSQDDNAEDGDDSAMYTDKAVSIEASARGLVVGEQRTIAMLAWHLRRASLWRAVTKALSALRVVCALRRGCEFAAS